MCRTRLTESDFDVDSHDSWVCAITRSSQKQIHPIRYILFLLFLCDSKEGVQRLFLDYDGFIKANSPRHKQRTNTSNEVWRYRLACLIEKGLTPWQISRELHCDYATVKKYSEQIQANKPAIKDTGVEILEKDIVHHRNILLEYIAKNPSTTVTDLRQRLSPHYAWLYKHDRSGLKGIVALLRKNRVRTNTSHPVDWCKRDIIVSQKIKDAYTKLIQEQPPVRISKYHLICSIHYASMWKCLDRLPETMTYINSVVETDDSFQKRKLIYEHSQIDDELHYEGFYCDIDYFKRSSGASPLS